MNFIRQHYENMAPHGFLTPNIQTAFSLVPHSVAVRSYSLFLTCLLAIRLTPNLP